MKKFFWVLYFLLIYFGLSLGGKCLHAAGDFQEAERILATKGQMQEGAWIVRFPRSDIKVTIAGEPIPTALGFGGVGCF